MSSTWVSWRYDFPVPLVPCNEHEETYVPSIQLLDMHMCYKFSGLTIKELSALDIYTYRVILINAFVNEANKTDEGRKMLKDYYRLNNRNSEFDKDGIMSIL